MSAVLRVVSAPWRWWKALSAEERVLYRAAVLLAAGCGLVFAPLALIVPGALFAAVFFNLRRAG
jgi:hypothetical protein